MCVVGFFFYHSRVPTGAVSVGQNNNSESRPVAYSTRTCSDMFNKCVINNYRLFAIIDGNAYLEMLPYLTHQCFNLNVGLL